MKSIAAAAASSLAHVALIPALALYGDSICPVLRSQGFGFGCVYSGMLVAWVLAANSIGVMAILKLRGGRFSTALVYGAIFAVGASGLLGYLGSLKLPVSSIARIQTALFSSAILLGALHVELMDWVYPRERKSRPLVDALWDLTPQAGALAVLAMVAYQLCAGIAAGELGPGSIELAAKELVLVSALLALWLFAIRAVRMLRESWRPEAAQVELLQLVNELRKSA